MKHEALGEMVVGIVVLRPEYQQDEVNIQQAMDDHLQDRLAKYKTPRKYYVVKALPRNHLGKVE